MVENADCREVSHDGQLSGKMPDTAHSCATHVDGVEKLQGGVDSLGGVRLTVAESSTAPAAPIMGNSHRAHTRTRMHMGCNLLPQISRLLQPYGAVSGLGQEPCALPSLTSATQLL